MYLRMSSGHLEPPSASESSFWKYQWEAFRTPLDVARLLPLCANNNIAQRFVQNDMDGFPEEHGDAFMRYFFTAYLMEPGSDAERGLTASFHFGAYAKHPLTEADRLGNPDIPFPVAFAYGDRDWLGSPGADQIVRGN